MSSHPRGRRSHVTAVVAIVNGDHEVARWPLAVPKPPDLGVVDYVARLQLAASRHGCRVRVDQAPKALADLLRLAGLARSITVTERGMDIEVGAESETGCCWSDLGPEG